VLAHDTDDEYENQTREVPAMDEGAFGGRLILVVWAFPFRSQTMFVPFGLSRFSEDPDQFTDTFKHQFLLTRDADSDFPGWLQTAAQGWTVFHAPDLPRTELTDRDGKPLGSLLGIAVDADGKSVRGKRQLDLSVDDADFLQLFETFVEGCAGRYVIALLIPQARRLYMDPVGDLATVYNPENGTAGSTNGLVMDREFIDNPVIPFGRVRTGEAAYTMGHTRDRVVKRLLASHYLDLDRMLPVRHWPRPDTDLETRRGRNQVLAVNDAITTRLGQIFCELLRTENCIMPLSGGRDSRCLLGTGLPEIHRAEFIYTWRFHRQSGKDCERAKEICAMLDLPHREFPFRKLTRSVKQQYLLRNGFALLGTALRSLAISEEIPGGHVSVRGNIMGILRATNWEGRREGVFNLPHALKRLRSGFSAEDQKAKFGDDFMAYYEAMPANAQNKIYDIAWTDIVLTHGQGVRNYGTPQNFVMNAFNDRKLLALSMQLPRNYRRRDKAYDRIVETTLPQLRNISYI
jgi:7-cyano-7-deazaguanine synthase in queuosine biosynthesis